MRALSDITGRESMTVTAKIIGPIAALTKDPDVMELLKQKPVKKGEDPQQVAMQRLADGLPALFERHGDEFLAILAAIDGKTVDEYEATLTLSSLILDFATLVKDPAFRDFLS